MRNTFLGLTRISLGWIFLWAFLDKLWGLGFGTAQQAAWINGGSPTTYWLSNLTRGPFADSFQALAGQGWVDWIFMIGLLLIGVALILGISMRLAVFGGVVMMILMYLAALWPEHNPFMDDHIVYALVLIVLLYSNAGDYLGLGRSWKNSRLAQKFAIFR